MPSNEPAPVQHVAVYARFSDKVQNPRSIEDQVALCRERVRAMGDVPVAVYTDAARTGTTLHRREGLRELLEQARAGRFDAVIAEALDRLSRDQADMARIYRELRYRNVKLYTVEEGEIEAMHIGFKGVMNESFVASLSAKTRRGQTALIRKGRMMTIVYGYRPANRLMADGVTVERGLREIVPEEAQTVRRIYRLYDEGKSPRDIALILNAEGVPGPRGGRWSPATIRGTRCEGYGILNNELYRGKLVYGRRCNVRDPETGKRRCRAVPRSQWVVQEAPALRVVDEALWERVQRRRGGAARGRRAAPYHRTLRPFSGLVRCGLCGGAITPSDESRYRCVTRKRYGACANDRGVLPAELERQSAHALLEALETHPTGWLRADAVALEAHRSSLARTLAKSRARIDRLLDAIETGAAPGAATQRRIVKLERAGQALAGELGGLPQPGTLEPDAAAARLKARVAALHREAVAGTDEARRAALFQLRELIERIVIAPDPRGGRRAITVEVQTNETGLRALSLTGPDG